MDENDPLDKEIHLSWTLLQMALMEDLDHAYDQTSNLLPDNLHGAASFVARSPGILAGGPIIRYLATNIDKNLDCKLLIEDGQPLTPGAVIAHISGPLFTLLTGERILLNFLQRLSGIATRTHQFTRLVADLPVKILDTRKTTPGWRALERYAVRQGGGYNHRFGLYDAVLIKDNHIAAMAKLQPKPITWLVEQARQKVPNLTVEVEVDTLEQLDEALAAKPEFILLDNMSLPMLREAVARRNAVAPQILLEASGGVNLDTVRDIALTGVDRISVGAITHSATSLDIGLDFEP